jgi:hypothetical protein
MAIDHTSPFASFYLLNDCTDIRLIKLGKLSVKPGDVFYKFRVIGNEFFLKDGGKQRKRYAVVACECGTIKCMEVHNLLCDGRQVRSCGCHHRQQSSVRIKAHSTSHGLSGTPTHSIWKGMRKRCYNERCKKYPRYGGRGITICERWQDYKNFLADMGPRPSPQHSIDRIDNDGNYEPGNCRWATNKQQANNTRTNRFIAFENETKTLAEWGRDPRCTVALYTLRARLKAGMPFGEAMSKPVRHQSASHSK